MQKMTLEVFNNLDHNNLTEEQEEKICEFVMDSLFDTVETEVTFNLTSYGAYITLISWLGLATEEGAIVTTQFCKSCRTWDVTVNTEYHEFTEDENDINNETNPSLQ